LNFLLGHLALVAITVYVVTSFIDLAVGQGLRVDSLSLDVHRHHVGECEQAVVLALLLSNAVNKLFKVLLQENFLYLV